ncbi:MAG: Trk system potassium transporter TrkA [Chitinispirillaceae bacterium]|nr:Trk system potassium transporter TrkA [Chitinispirillaceae bacterium]
MNIVIVGAGVVGYSLAEHLSRQGHRTSVIEKSIHLCSEINSKLDVLTINENGANPRILEMAGIKEAEMVIAVTPNDDTNLVVCNFAMQYGVLRRIARIRSLKLSDLQPPASFASLGVTHVIEPEMEVVDNILKYIELPGVTEAENIQMGNAYLRGYRITEDMPITGKTLIETNELTKSSQILIVLIIRNGKAILPRGTEIIRPGDEIIAIMRDDSLPKFRELINQPSGKFKKLVVSGDTIEAVELARSMHDFADRVILVDPKADHAQEAAATLPDVEVLLGDCTDVEVLQEVRVRDTPFFIAAGSDPEDNIMSRLLAKAEGAQRVIAISNNRRHSKLFVSLGIDYVINPNTITIQTIMRNIIRLPIASLLSLKSVNILVTRFIIGPKSAVIDLPIKLIGNRIKRSIIIGSIFRGEELIIPSGDTIFREDDEVLVLSQPGDTKEVGKLFGSQTVI